MNLFRYSINISKWLIFFFSIILNKINSFYVETKENVDLSCLTNSNPDVEIKRLKTKEDSAVKAGEDMEDILTCVCCQDIMSNPICLEPCLHAFCHDCYTSWEAIQRTW